MTLRETLAQRVSEIPTIVPVVDLYNFVNDSYVNGYREGCGDTRTAAATLIAESAELVEVEQSLELATRNGFFNGIEALHAVQSRFADEQAAELSVLRKENETLKTACRDFLGRLDTFMHHPMFVMNLIAEVAPKMRAALRQEQTDG